MESKEGGHQGMMHEVSVSRSRSARFGVGMSVSAGILLIACGGGDPAPPTEDPSPHSEASLVLETETVRPGEQFFVGLRFELEPGWHSYWLNPGDAGQPASIHWNLPQGFRVGEVHWPYPQVVEESSVVSYGYFDEVMLLVEVFPASTVDVGQIKRIEAEVHWLVCSNICLPASANLALDVETDRKQPVQDKAWQSAFSNSRRDLPGEPTTWAISAVQTDTMVVLLVLPAESHEIQFDSAQFFATDRRTIAHTSPQVFTRGNGGVRLDLRKSRFLQDPLERLQGVLVVSGHDPAAQGRSQAYNVDVELGEPEHN